MGFPQLASRRSGEIRSRRSPYSEGCAWVRVRGAFFPDLIEARAGERLRLVFRREETAPCSEQVVIASLGKSVMLPPFEDVAVDLGPLEAGEHEFSCELGVLRGRIVVGDRAAARSAELPRHAAETPNRQGVHSTDDLTATRSYAASELRKAKARRRFAEMKRPTINITPAERLGRILVGAVAAIGGIVLLGSGGGALVVVLEVLLVLAGLDLVATGALGHCPLYRKLGYTPKSLRGGHHEHPRPS